MLSRISCAVAVIAALITPQISLAAGTYDVPSPTQPEAQAYVQRFVAEYPKVEADASYFVPLAGAAWPCEVSQRDQYMAAGLFAALPEVREKNVKATRKMFREMGMDPSTPAGFDYSDVRITPVRANCKDGKLNGEVEVIAEYVAKMVTNNAMDLGTKHVNMVITMTQTETYRVVSTFGEGNPRAVRGVKRTFMKNVTTYDDEEMTKMMAKAALPESKDPNIAFLYFPPGGKGLMGTFTIMTLPKVSAGFLGANVNLQREVMTIFMEMGDPAGMKSEMFNGKEMTSASTMPMKDGVMHGEQVILSQNYLKKNNLRMDQVSGMEQARIVNYKGQEMIEQRNCYIEGKIVKTPNCPKD